MGNINIDTDFVCHFTCSYLHFINIPVSIFVYSQTPNEKYIFDMIGITTLSVSSYIYHYDIYKRLLTKKIEEYFVPNCENIVLFLNDAIIINVRSFLVVVTNYFYNSNITYVLSLSAVLHIYSVYYSVLNSFELLKTNDENKFAVLHQITMSIPIMCDVFLICNNSTKETAIPFLLSNVLIIIILLVKPFYKLNHTAFHLVLIAQNYFICLCNSSN